MGTTQYYYTALSNMAICSHDDEILKKRVQLIIVRYYFVYILLLHGVRMIQLHGVRFRICFNWNYCVNVKIVARTLWPNVYSSK